MKKTTNIMDAPSMKLFTMLCNYFLLVLVLYTICQFLNLKNFFAVIQIVSIVIPIIIYLLTNKKIEKVKIVIMVISLYLFLLLILPFISGKTYDLTVDGNSYHKTAIAFIKNGWNPIYESSTEFQKDNKNIVAFDKTTRINLWIEHYPKATWILAANFYEMTGNIESGKCITLILSIMLLIISYNCLRRVLDKRWSIIISALVVLNPITLAQIFSYYVDGIMGICFVMELLLLFLVKPMEKQSKSIWLCLASIVTLFCNLKYTGLLCSGIIAAVFYFYWLIKYKKEQAFIRILKKMTVNFTIVFVTAIFFVGANSYVKNTIDHMNPLYPLIGKDKVDIITTMQPKVFGELSMPQKFVRSLFGKTENTTYTMGDPEWKLPIKVYRSEISELLAPDVRIGGFGPLFALATILSIIVLIYGLILFVKYEKKNIKYITIPTIAILLTMILLGENWWARYVPQFYLLPIGTIILIIYTAKYMKKQKVASIMALIIITVLTANCTFFLYTNYVNIKSFVEINRDIKEMKNTKNLKLKLGTKNLYGYYYNLNDQSIDYKLVEEIPEERKKYKYSWRIEVEENEEISKIN